MKPVKYHKLSREDKKRVREDYIRSQNNKCYYCNGLLDKEPNSKITSMKIDWGLFPPNFLKYPVHLHHDHTSGMTLGAVHAYCNAVLWQYYGE